MEMIGADQPDDDDPPAKADESEFNISIMK